jgi:AcrR family transcriptional regulator
VATRTTDVHPTVARGRPREFDLDGALDRALEIFARDGYEGASVNEIATAIGISKPSLYAAFGDKEALFLAALDRYQANQAAHHRAVLDDEPDVFRAMESFLVSIADAHTNPAGSSGCLIVSATSTCDAAAVPEAVKTRLQEALRAGEAAIARRLTRAKADGALPASAKVQVLSAYFNTVIAGMGVQAKGGASRATLRAVATSAMRALPTA